MSTVDHLREELKRVEALCKLCEREGDPDLYEERDGLRSTLYAAEKKLLGTLPWTS
jgi:hypothetical protein